MQNHRPVTSQEPDESKPLVVELFAGICGASLAFREVGFEIALLADTDKLARKAFVHNYAELADRYLSVDIRRLTVPEVRRKSGKRIAGVLGCPPCQGLSDVGLRKHVDPRNHLLDEFIRLIRGIQPAFFVMENVPKLLDYSRFHAAIGRLKSRYSIWAGVLNGALYGLPQTRHRVIAIGYSRDLRVSPSPPATTHGWTNRVFAYDLLRTLQPSNDFLTSVLGRCRGTTTYAEAHVPECRRPLPLVTCADALSDLPSPNVPRAGSYRQSPSTPYQRWARLDSPGVHNHEAWHHTENLLRRMTEIGPGESLLSQCGRQHHRYYSQAYGRLHPRGLARTVTTNFHNPGSGRFLHYAQNRSLTIREAARLQGIPDKFVFPSSIPQTAQERLVGNAFPLIWAQAIALHVANQIGKLL